MLLTRNGATTNGCKLQQAHKALAEAFGLGVGGFQGE
jgi:hypothetical protein